MDCEACNGRGWLKAFNTETKHTEIQRCDACEKYVNDREAVETVVEIYEDMLCMLRALRQDLENNGEMFGTDQRRIEAMTDCINRAKGE